MLEQRRLIRDDNGGLRGEIVSLKKEVHGLKLGAVAEFYKANRTVASFVDHEQRSQALERKSP